MQLIAFGKGYPLLPLLNKQTLYRMKLLVFLLTAACVNATATGYTQTIDVKLNNASLQEVFKTIETQTDYRFIYTTEQLQKLPGISIHVKNAELEKVLKLCLSGMPLSYTIEDRLIIIHKKEPVKRSDFQDKTFHDIKGTVRNKDGRYLSGITILVKGTSQATVTDNNGEFTLNNISPDATLIVSSAEMETQVINVNGKSFFAIVLSQKVGELDETIVVGYGTTTRRFSTGSVTKVGADEINKQPVANPLAALQGRVPGLIVSSTSGIPGASFKIQVRGQNSLNPNPNSIFVNPQDNPFFIIDGVPFAPQNTNINQFSSLAAPGPNEIFANPYGGISPFSMLNPADIESIEILKDADATAIYGSRAANGVILITTKKGKVGTTRFGVTISSGFSQVTRSMQLLETDDYLKMRKEAFQNDGASPDLIFGSRAYAPDLLVFDSTRNIDWKEYFIGGTAKANDINARLSGGSDNTQFSLGAGFHHETFVLPGNFWNARASVNAHIHHQSTNKKFTFDFSTNYSYNENNSSGSPSLLQAFTLPPNYPDLFQPNGELQWNYKGVELRENPAAYLKQQYLGKTNNLISNLQLNYRIFPGFSLLSSFGFNQLNGNENSKVPKSSLNPFEPGTSYANFGTNQFATWIVEPQLEYKRSLGIGELTVLMGTTIQQNTHRQTSTSGYGYPDDALLGSITAATEKIVSDGEAKYKYNALFGRINYIHKKRYIINLNARRDGSSRFGPGKQFGNFGSAGAGWLFSEERIVKKAIPVISFGKLRASYGITGNDNIGDYQFLSLWSSTVGQLNPLQGLSGYVPQNHYNPNLSWSITHKAEIGLEFGFLRDCILGSISWYQNKSSKQLVTYQLPTQTGFSGVTANFPAVIQNNGWEFQLNTRIIRRNHFSWNTSFNISFPKNKLASFPDIENSSYANIYRVGQPVSVLYKFQLIGVDPMTGIYTYQSKNGNANSPRRVEDYFVIGNQEMQFGGGLNNTLTYKTLSLDVFTEFRKQKGANYLRQINSFAPGRMFNQPSGVLERWQHPGDQTTIQQFTSNSRTTAGRAATAFTNSSGAFSDASFIRIKTIALSYSLNERLVRKLHMESCRFFLNAQNLFTITGYKGNDPETQSFYSLPPLKTLVAGIQFNF